MAIKRVSQRELAKVSGVPQATISRVLSGKIQSPTIDVLKKLARALGVTVDYLIMEQDLEEILLSDDRVQHLVRIYADLGEEGREQLYTFARFLHTERRGE